MTKQTPLEKIAQLAPCATGRDWLRPYRSVQKAWDECTRPDWMGWLLGWAVRKNTLSLETLGTFLLTLVRPYIKKCKDARIKEAFWLISTHGPAGEIVLDGSLDNTLDDHLIFREGMSILDLRIRYVVKDLHYLYTKDDGPFEVGEVLRGLIYVIEVLLLNKKQVEILSYTEMKKIRKRLCDKIRSKFPRPPRLSRRVKQEAA